MTTSLPRHPTAALAALLLLPVLQRAVEAVVTLPIGPSRMLTLGLWSAAWVPIASFALRRLGGSPLPRVAIAITALIVPLLVLAHVLALARLGDGPFGPVPGGPFRSAASPAPGDWSSVSALRYAEVEVDAARPRTLETLVLVHDEALFIAANMPEGKRWPRTVRSEGRVRVRLDGEHVHALEARFVDERDRVTVLRDAMAAKYGFDVSMGGPIWFFALERPS